MRVAQPVHPKGGKPRRRERCRQEDEEAPGVGGLVEVGKQIVERGGVGGLYRGLSATVASDVWGIGVGFFLYDTVNAAFKQTFGRAIRMSSVLRAVRLWPTDAH